MQAEYLILTVRNGAAIWVALANTERAMESIRKRSQKAAFPNDQVVVLSVKDILAWHRASVEELEAMARL